MLQNWIQWPRKPQGPFKYFLSPLVVWTRKMGIKSSICIKLFYIKGFSGCSAGRVIVLVPCLPFLGVSWWWVKFLKLSYSRHCTPWVVLHFTLPTFSWNFCTLFLRHDALDGFFPAILLLHAQLSIYTCSLVGFVISNTMKMTQNQHQQTKY